MTQAGQNVHTEFDQADMEILGKLDANDSGPTGAGPEMLQPQAAPAAAPAPAPVASAPAAAPAAQAPVASPAAAPAPAAETPAPQGDTRVALRAARRSERRLASEVERLRQELEDTRAGKAPASTQLSEDEIAQLEADFPVQGKLARRQQQLEAELQQTRQAAAPPPEFEPLQYHPDTQAVIDDVPDLLAWQHDPAAQDKFKAAIEEDRTLLADPTWKDKPLAERFAEAARRVKNPSPATPQRLDPAAVIAAATLAKPSGISDFSGGSPPGNTLPNFAAMTDEQVMASLPVT